MARAMPGQPGQPPKPGQPQKPGQPNTDQADAADIDAAEKLVSKMGSQSNLDADTIRQKVKSNISSVGKSQNDVDFMAGMVQGQLAAQGRVKESTKKTSNGTATITPHTNKGKEGYRLIVKDKKDKKPSSFWYEDKEAALKFAKDSGYTIKGK